MGALRVVQLKTEGFREPLGIDAPMPRFSWQIQAKARGLQQSHYQIRCASTLERLVSGKPALWESGWVQSAHLHAYYQGTPLKSRQRVYWQVRSRDTHGRESEWSAPTWFEMGLLNPTDWQARWIAPHADSTPIQGVCRDPVNRPPATLCPYLRKPFYLHNAVLSARLYATGLGYYELYLNGRRVGDAVLEPSYTPYHKRIEYRTYDVTALLREGANCLGALLGQGWWAGPLCLLAQLEITLADGTRRVLSTDRSWRWAPSPIVENSLYGGETYDARLEIARWAQPSLKPRRGVWRPVRVVRMPKRIALSASPIEPIHVVETLEPVAITSPKPGAQVYDFGQNFSGWCRLVVQGAHGAQVRLRHAELVYPDGTINPENLRGAKSTDTYILKGRGKETYEPRFTYHGFRYVQVEAEGAKVLHLQGRVVHTAFESRGHFACSNPLLNQIHQNARWGFRTNFHSVPTDCPQRDERQGWMGDAHMTCAMGLYNFNTEQAYRKFLRDIADEQGADGSIPDTVPHVWGTRPGDPMWAIAYPIIAWTLYQHTGDREVLHTHYPNLRKYLRSLEREAPNGILERNNYGDWVAVEEGTPKPLVSTVAYALTAKIVGQIAQVLGDERTVRHTTWLHRKIAKAFHQAFYNAETGEYGNGTQASNALALAGELVPPTLVPQIVNALVYNIREQHKGHLATGFIGTRFLLDVLTAHGHAETAYLIASQRTYPSWGYMIENGATTIWELWRLETGGGMNSHNHPAFGFISGWFFDTLVGLRPQEGWYRFQVVPHPVGDLRWVEGRIKTPLGEVACRWEQSEGQLMLQLQVPSGAQATLMLPTLGLKNPILLESGRPLSRTGKPSWLPAGIGHLEPHSSERLSVQVGSGVYRFSLYDLKDKEQS